MKISELKQITSAPQSGYILGYLSKEVVFEPYHSLDEVTHRFKDEDLLELHLFNDEKEYRTIQSRSIRYEKQNGIIEYISDFDVSDNTVFCEDVLLERGGSICVLNHIAYDSSNGMAVIDDSRLVMQEGE